MKAKTAAGFTISLISVLGINFIPLEMFLYREFSGESAMVFYALENILAIGFAYVFIQFFAPHTEENQDFKRRDEILNEHPAFPIEKVRKKAEILKLYLVFSIGFSAATLVFLTAFIFLILKAEIQFAAIVSGLAWISGFLCFEFLGDTLMLRPLTLAKSEEFLKRSMGRIALLFLSVFLGVFLALFVDKWFVLPFVGLKTLVDVVGIIQIFTLERAS